MKPQMSFTGEIKEVDGFKKLEIKNRAYYLTRLQKATLGKCRIIIEQEKITRSNAQNRYYWGVVLPTIAEETGEDDIYRLHDLFKAKFLPRIYETVLGEEVLREQTTTVLSKEEFAEYIRKIEKMTGVEVPSPCESGYYCGKTSCFICAKK